MEKYLAKLLFNISLDGGKDQTRFDEQVRVIESRSLEDAFFKARVIGKKEEETFLDSSNNLVSWQFIDVAEVYPIGSMSDGEQIYSQTHVTSDAPSYISYIKRKSMEIQAKSLTFA